MKKTVMEEIKTYKEYDAKLEKDFAALLADRNRLAEENRKCCDENERLRDALCSLMDAVGRFLDTPCAERLPMEVTALMCKALAKAIEARDC